MKIYIFPLIPYINGGKFFIFNIIFLICFQNYAQGDLLIYPKRITFKGTQNRVQIIHLNNIGKDTTIYKLSFLENRMLEDGKFEIIEEPDTGQFFASPYLRFHPRTVTLAPNETQVVKVQLIKTQEMSAGEYRSHLYFRPVHKSPPHQNIMDYPENSEGISINLQPVYGLSIANIIEIGDPQVQIEISNVAFEKFNDTIPVISMDFIREGNASSYGDIEVHHISSKGIKTTVGEIKGFAVYTPNNFRSTRMKLKSEGVDYGAGKIEVSYVLSYVSPNIQRKIYAKKILVLKP